MSKKPRYEKKETLGKRSIRNCWSVNDLRKIDIMLGQVYDLNKKEVEKHKDRMRKLGSLYREFMTNPRIYVEKYAKLDKNERMLKVLKDNPNLFEDGKLSA